ncbi:MAG: hypothetical protein J6S96_08595 [Muribaculaceae bacterium]|nr:hypothetical protein [Muribaculaceae bacterium]
MKTKLSLLALIIIGLAQIACATIPVPHQINGYGFLRYNGIDVSKLNIIDGAFTIEENTELYPLEGKQLIALLDDVRHMDYYINVADGRDGGYSIAGVHDNGYFSIVVYSIEYGDGGCIEMGIYDDKGKLWDFLDLGYWYEYIGCNIDDGPESDATIRTNTTLTFNEDHTFTLIIAGEMHPINAEPTESNLMGKMTKTIHYGYKERRYFELKEIDVEYSDPEMEQFFPFDDITDLRYVPKSEVYGKLDTLNGLIVSKDVAEDLQNEEYSNANYMITHTVARWLEMNTEDIFSWLTYHHDPAKHHLLPFVEDCYKSYVADPGMIKYAVERFKSVSPKNYAIRLMQQWDKDLEQ